jgi:hypothetical protein
MAECSVGLLMTLPSDVLYLVCLQCLDLATVCKLSAACVELNVLARRAVAYKITMLPCRPYITQRGNTRWLCGPVPVQTLQGSLDREGPLVARRRKRRWSAWRPIPSPPLH